MARRSESGAPSWMRKPTVITVDNLEFKVDGTSDQTVKDSGTDYGVWRIVTTDTNSLVTALYGPNSFAAAIAVCEMLNKAGGLLSLPDADKSLLYQGVEKSQS